MSDILERLKVWQSEKGYVRGHRTGELLLGAIAEIERLRAGGCARDQQTTQYCGEAARLAKENAELLDSLRSLLASDDQLREITVKYPTSSDLVYYANEHWFTVKSAARSVIYKIEAYNSNTRKD